MVTIRLPLDRRFASRTEATRLQALEEPSHRPSCLTSHLDIATASSSETRYASSIMSKPNAKLCVIYPLAGREDTRLEKHTRLIPIPSTTVST